MNDDIKIIANYLPQYHRIPENDRWWGKGFTDWETVKRATPLFEGHCQPRVPLNNHYYSLDSSVEIQWQVDLAKKYGVYGFGIYHYWFSSNMNLLQKPAELLLENVDIDIHFCFLWDNNSWVRTWSNVKQNTNVWSPKFDGKIDNFDSGMLAELVYGNKEEWKKHFLYLVPFFKDKRYIRYHNKPLFGFMSPNNEWAIIKEMVAYWNELAIESGFDGILCMTREHWINKGLQYRFRYSPLCRTAIVPGAWNKVKESVAKRKGTTLYFDYDKTWRGILNEASNSDSKTFLSGFVGFDDSPRRGIKGRICRGSTPEKFEHYMSELLSISKKQNKEYVFLTAWNEWGEGCYLEPDIISGYRYLEALKSAVERVNMQ